MVVPTLVLDGAFALATAVVYAYVGRALWARRVEGEGRRAAALFSTWWHGLAVTTAIAASMRVLAGLGLLTLPLYEAAVYVTLVSLCVALFGLLYYLLFLFTGRSRLLLPLATYYAGLYALLVALLADAQPVGFVAEGWTLRLEYANPPTGWRVTGPLVLVLLPHLLGALAYMRLFFTLKDPTQRYRVALVSGSILGWFGSALLASESQLATWEWWPLVSRSISIVAAITILLAYLPPAWVRQRWRVASVRDETASG